MSKEEKKKKKREVVVGNVCPYCQNREFSSQWHLKEHIKNSHKDERRSII